MNKEEAIKIRQLFEKEEEPDIFLKNFHSNLPNGTILLNGYADETYLSDCIFGDEYCYKYKTKLLVVNNNFVLSKKDIEPDTKEREETSIIGEKIDLEFLHKYFDKILIEETEYNFVKYLHSLGYDDYLEENFIRFIHEQIC